MDILIALKECLTGSSSSYETLPKPSYTSTSDVKVPISPTPPTNSEMSTTLLTTLFKSSKSLSSLRTQLASQIHPSNLTTHLAQHLLDGLIHALNSGKVMGSTMKEAFDRASVVVEEFVKEHPVLTAVAVTLVAIGILVLVFPWAVEALGFGSLGPIKGSFAALWQATFPDVTAESWFAFFQRLGMIWGKTAVVMIPKL
ncbi:hypothetical protein VTL71DRAFT_16359 [Oculimacula yallundae]|uniref:Lincomycin-condensing protein lmbA n=1 Tax=Oculimacula yallundae TaxID=86028 RepID=A0ABR4CE74_9HELO